MDQFELYLQYQKEVSKARLTVIERFEKMGRRLPKQRTSNIDIVEIVLNNAGHPLHVSEIIRSDLLPRNH